MTDKTFSQITKKNSATFYHAALFFPTEQRNDIFTLYAFLRYFDDLVDVHRDKKMFFYAKRAVSRALKEKRKTHDHLLDAFVDVFYTYHFKQEWLHSFWKSLEKDFKPKLRIQTYGELETYLYGVAGVVGLMMAKILTLPPQGYIPAQALGKAMQLINIIRDSKEDYALNRIYLPNEDFKKFNLKNGIEYHKKHKSDYSSLIRFEIKKAWKLFTVARNGIQYIPPVYRKPICISLEMYYELSKKIYRQPLRIWKEKTKVSKTKFLWILIKNIL